MNTSQQYDEPASAETLGDLIPGLAEYDMMPILERPVWHERIHAASKSLAWSVFWLGFTALVIAVVGSAVYELLTNVERIAEQILGNPT